MSPTDTFIDVGDDPRDLCKRLKAMNYLDTCDMRKVSVSDMSKDIVEVRSKKSLKPFCRLEIARWINK